MSNYTKTTNFTAKDAIPSGDPGKIILGSEHDTEYDAIAVAIATKADDSDVVHTTGTETVGGNKTFTDANLFLGDNLFTGNNAIKITAGTITGIADLAIADGGTGASTAADARTNLGLGALAVLASVDQSTIDAASVGQGELKTTTGTATFNYGANDVAHDSHYAMPGGTYGFMPQTSVSGSGSYNDLNVAFRAGVGAYTGGAFSTAYMRITSSGIASDASGSITATQRYVQASPPYDLGDGPIEQFTFLVVDSLGNARHVWSATEAPWHYNGPTQIAAQRIDRATGRKYRRMHPLVAEFGSMRAAMKALPVAAMNSRLAGAQVEVEITQVMKQADMPLIPHPFGFALKPDETLIILDPVSPVMQRLAELQSEGIPVGELIAQGYLQFGNTALPRKAPPGVMPVSVAWRRTT